MTFFPYNPRKIRLGFVLGAVACAALTFWALQNARTGSEPYGMARAGVAAGLMFAFLYALIRLRPREGWGLRLEPLTLHVSRPLSSGALPIVQTEVEMARRDGKRQDTVVLYLKNGQRVVIAQHLFPSKAAFDDAARALKNWAPEPQLDA